MINKMKALLFLVNVIIFAGYSPVALAQDSTLATRIADPVILSRCDVTIVKGAKTPEFFKKFNMSLVEDIVKINITDDQKNDTVTNEFKAKDALTTNSDMTVIKLQDDKSATSVAIDHAAGSFTMHDLALTLDKCTAK